MALALLDLGGFRERAATRAVEDDAASADEPRASSDRAPARTLPRKRPSAKPGAPRARQTADPARKACESYARKACHQGDVWWLDSCGVATERVEACDGRACLGVGCAPASIAPDDCAGVPVQGICSGEVASACVGGTAFTVDCTELGQRCVMTREGARCVKRTRRDCSATDSAQCVGDSLRRCVDGQWDDLDCAKRLGRCALSGGGAQCIGGQAPSASTTPIERCDGEDDDRDGAIDEDAVCDAVPLVAFIAGGVPGGSVPDGFDAQLERDLANVNRIYHPLTFRWAKIMPKAVATRVHPDELDGFARLLSREPELPFFIPVLYVEEITSQPETSGQASLPNATCGGIRLTDHAAPPEGIVVVSASRQPDTLAHELGHYLGLCHTHDELVSYGLIPQSVECDLSGDGICDTPWDPGPERCALLRACGIACADPVAQPDVSNVMSYYMPCRRGLSAEQLALVERGLQLRRGWFPCLDADQCRCLPGEPGDCPTQMSCRPSGQGESGVCKLDGPALPGAPCEDVSDCSNGSVCLGAGAGDARVSRCVRACRVSAPDCACSDVGLPFPVCGEDLER